MNSYDDDEITRLIKEKCLAVSDVTSGKKSWEETNSTNDNNQQVSGNLHKKVSDKTKEFLSSTNVDAVLKEYAKSFESVLDFHEQSREISIREAAALFYIQSVSNDQKETKFTKNS